MSYQSERQLLGTILKHGATPDAMDAVESLSEKHFTEQGHRALFDAIRNLTHHSMPINLGMMLDRAPEAYELAASLIHEATTEKAIERLAKSVKSSYSALLTEKMLLKALDQVKSAPQEYEHAITKLEANLQTLEGSESDSEPLVFETYAKGYIDLIQERLDGKEEALGLDIGLDTQLNRTDMVLIAAPSGMGKTSLSMFCAEYVARQNKKVLYFSLEMEGMQLFEREVTRVGRMTSNSLKDPMKYNLDYSSLTAGVLAAKELPIFVDDSSKLSVFALKRKARRFKAKNPDLSAIFVDYLTLMDLPDGDRRDLQLTEASRQIKLFAKEIKTPVIVLAQVNKQAGKLGREPVKEDIRDGAIENDADKIFMPWRDDVATPESPNKGIAKVVKAKVRDGSCEPVLMRFENGNFYKTDNLEWVDNDSTNKRGGGFEA